MALLNQHICTFLNEPFLCHAAISTNIKCAGSFDLFFVLNQPNLTFFRYKEMIATGISMKFTICGRNYYS